MSYVFNFLAEILLILTYDLGSTDQTVKDSSFHMMLVGGLEMQIMTEMSKKGRVSLTSTSVVNLMVGLRLLGGEEIAAMLLVRVANPQKCCQGI
jgi:hypothetical protein